MKGLFPGTFDPPSLGHLDIIERSAKVCDQLVVAVARNYEKVEELFTVDERVLMLQEVTKGMGNVEVTTFVGLAADFAEKHGIDCFVRGLRAHSDVEYEFRMALANRKLSGKETLFLMSGQQHGHISSTLIREIGREGHSLGDFVPKAIEEQILARLS
jgi:pantetheine-phosphate adenylyltransferase